MNKRIGSVMTRLRPRRLGRRGLIVVAAAGLLVGGGGVAFAAVAASSPIDGNNVIHGCYTNAAINGSHVFVLQDAGTSCPKGTTAISWNSQGTPGTPGTNGTNGVSPTVAPFTGSEGSCTSGGDAITDANGNVTYVCDGTSGTNGPGSTGPSTAGPGGLNTTIVTVGGVGSATANCPQAEPYLLGGGGSDNTITNNSAGSLSYSGPAHGGQQGNAAEASGTVYGWTVYATAGPAGSDSVTAYAICSN